VVVPVVAAMVFVTTYGSTSGGTGVSGVGGRSGRGPGGFGGDSILALCHLQYLVEL
jgi:hypothetical protein